MINMSTESIVGFLCDEVAIFHDFPADKLVDLVHGSRVMTYEPNEAIIKFGEDGRFIGVLLEGTAQASYTDDSGQVHPVGALKSGDIFGEMAVMTGDTRMADIIGIVRCKVLIIPQALFSTLLVIHPPAIRYLSKVISERSRQLGLVDSREELGISAVKKSEDPYGLNLHSDKLETLLIIDCTASALKYAVYDTMDEKNPINGVIAPLGSQAALHN